MGWHHLLHDAWFWVAVAGGGTLLILVIWGVAAAFGSGGRSSYSSAVARQNAEAQRTMTGVRQAYDRLDTDMRRVARDRRPHS